MPRFGAFFITACNTRYGIGVTADTIDLARQQLVLFLATNFAGAVLTDLQEFA